MRKHVLALNVGLLSFALVFSVLSQVGDAGKKKEKKKKDPPIVRLSYDPDAEKVELFEGMESGALQSWVVLEDEFIGNVYIKNTTDKPLTVKLPEAVVTVHNLKQFGGGMMGGMGGMGGGMMGGMGGGMMGGMGGGMMGGGMQMGGGGMMGGMGGMGMMGGMGGGMMGGMGGGMMGGMGGMGGGFFSIPPQRRVQIGYHGVCLNHGKESPNALMRYYLVPVEKYTKNETLQELLRMVSTGRLNPAAAQAATWFMTDGLSFPQLAAKEQYFMGVAAPYFNEKELELAQKILVLANQRAKLRKKLKENPQPATPVTPGSPRRSLSPVRPTFPGSPRPIVSPATTTQR